MILKVYFYFGQNANIDFLNKKCYNFTEEKKNGYKKQNNNKTRFDKA